MCEITGPISGETFKVYGPGGVASVILHELFIVVFWLLSKLLYVVFWLVVILLCGPLILLLCPHMLYSKKKAMSLAVVASSQVAAAPSPADAKAASTQVKLLEKAFTYVDHAEAAGVLSNISEVEMILVNLAQALSRPETLLHSTTVLKAMLPLLDKLLVVNFSSSQQFQLGTTILQALAARLTKLVVDGALTPSDEEAVLDILLKVMKGFPELAQILGWVDRVPALLDFVCAESNFGTGLWQSKLSTLELIGSDAVDDGLTAMNAEDAVTRLMKLLKRAASSGTGVHTVSVVKAIAPLLREEACRDEAMDMQFPQLVISELRRLELGSAIKPLFLNFTGLAFGLLATNPAHGVTIAKLGVASTCLNFSADCDTDVLCALSWAMKNLCYDPESRELVRLPACELFKKNTYNVEAPDLTKACNLNHSIGNNLLFSSSSVKPKNPNPLAMEGAPKPKYVRRGGGAAASGSSKSFTSSSGKLEGAPGATAPTFSDAKDGKDGKGSARANPAYGLTSRPSGSSKSEAV